MPNIRITHKLVKSVAFLSIFVTGTASIHSADAATAQVLYQFSAYPQGNAPGPGLLTTSAGIIYGTAGGGAFGSGVIYRVLPDGTKTILYNFPGIPAFTPPSSSLMQGSDGLLYGVVSSPNSTTSTGNIYRFDPVTLKMSVLHTFGAEPGLQYPLGDLVAGKDGALYGVAAQGGTNGYGGVFRYSLSGVYSIVHSFTSVENFPSLSQKLLLAPDGFLYGVTPYGGVNGLGTIFKIAADGTTIRIHDFSANEPRYPSCGLILGADGRLWGGTQFGGANSFGTVFNIGIDGTGLTTVHSFSASEGGSPSTPLLLGRDGKYYAITTTYYPLPIDTLFSVAPNGQYASVHRFVYDEGYSISGALTADSTGAIIGAMSSGGTNGCGAVFKVNAAGAFSIPASFTAIDGAGAIRPPVLAEDGNLYGVTVAGGDHNNGVVYRLTPSGAISILHHFSTPNFIAFIAGLVLGRDGNLYGVGYEGLQAVAYRITLDGKYSVIYQFPASLRGNLTAGSDGYLYGATTREIYRLTVAGTYSVVAVPPSGVAVNSLSLAGDGNLYGIASPSGSDPNGSLVRFTSSGVFSKVHTFTGTSDGGAPYTDLFIGGDGNVYGATTRNYSTSNGTVFRCATGGAFSTICALPLSQRTYIGGPPVVAQDGTVYVCGDDDTASYVLAAKSGQTPTPISTISPAGYFNASRSMKLILNADGGIYGAKPYGGLHGDGLVFKVASNAALFQHAVAIASGADNHTHALWLNVLGDSSLWNINEATSQYTHREFNGAPGEARFVAAGPDGKTRVVYNYGNNITTLRSVDEGTGATRENVFRNFNGMPVKAISVGGDNRSRLVLGAQNGDIALTIVNETDWSYTQKAFPHPAGATFVGAATGSDNHTHVVWSKGVGAVTIWNIDPSGTVTTAGFAANSAWIPTVVSVGADNKTRVGWTNSRGEFLLWIVQDGAVAPVEKTFASPGRYTLSGMSASPDGKTHAAWTATNGKLLLWAINEAVGTHTDSAFAP